MSEPSYQTRSASCQGRILGYDLKSTEFLQLNRARHQIDLTAYKYTGGETGHEQCCTLEHHTAVVVSLDKDGKPSWELKEPVWNRTSPHLVALSFLEDVGTACNEDGTDFKLPEDWSQFDVSRDVWFFPKTGPDKVQLKSGDINVESCRTKFDRVYRRSVGIGAQDQCATLDQNVDQSKCRGHANAP